jgi:hypothetical protein
VGSAAFFDLPAGLLLSRFYRMNTDPSTDTSRLTFTERIKGSFAKRANDLKTLSAKGEEIIVTIRKFLEELDLKDCLQIVGQTRSSLSICYFGLPLTFRTELSCKPGAYGRIMVFWKTHGENAAEKLLLGLADYQFDRLGNVLVKGGLFTIAKFAPSFVEDVFFTMSKSDDLWLRP